MAFDYNGTISKANALNEYAELIKGYRNEIIALKSSLNDYWKNAMVPQVPELFCDADVNLDNVYKELKQLSTDIVIAANHIRDEEIRQQQEAQRREEQRRQQEAAALAARQTVNVVQPAPQPTPTPPPAKTKINNNKSSKKASKSKEKSGAEKFWDFINPFD